MLAKVFYCLLPTPVFAALLAIWIPDHFIDGLSIRAYAIIAFSIVSIQLGVAGFFLSGLRNYQPKLRHAYQMLALGILLLGVAQIQLPVALGYRLLDSWWVSSGLILAPFALSTLAVYLSGYLQNRALGLRTHILTPALVVPAIIALCAASFLLPHRRITGSPAAELSFDAFIAITLWMLLFNIAATIIYWRAQKHIAPLYAYAMKWLVAALALGAAGSCAELLYSLLTPESLTWYTRYGLNLLPLLLTSTVLLAAGAEFKQIADSRLSPTATPVDVITHVAQLVSSPEEIDTQLDALRVITIGLSGPEASQLTPQDEKVLADLYVAIESYLLQKETVRRFTQEELRAQLPETFLTLLARNSPNVPAVLLHQ